MICRGETTQREGDPIPHIVWPGGLVNLVLLTVAKGGPCNRLSASESTRVPGVIISPVVQFQPPFGIRAEQKRKETVEHFPPLGSSVLIFSLEITVAPNNFRQVPGKFPTERKKHDM